MRITKIEMENLNSLKGYWCIDLTHPDYAKNHDLFVICGETGSGKTTILDAITLALYGRTPRQDSFGTSNELMTRRTGSCMARVTYECKKGRYVAEFHQNKAHSKAEGSLQKAYGIVTNADSGESSGNLSITALEARTAEIVQLRYDQFIRSIMLAQGDFSSFIESKPKERADILAKINGTEKYKKFASRLWDKAKVKIEECKKLEAAAKEIKVLSEEEVKAVENTIKEKEAEIEGIQKKLEENAKAMDWLEKIGQAEVKLASEKEKLCVLEKEYEECSRKSQEALEAFKEKSRALGENEELWKKVRLLDERISAALEKTDDAQKRLETSQAEYKDKVCRLENCMAEIEKLEKENLELKPYLDQHDGDRELEKVIPVLEQQKKLLEDWSEKAGSAEKRLTAEKENLKALENNLTKEKEKLTQADADLAELVKIEYLSVSLLIRKGLEKGKPCPVCGSKEHGDCNENQAQLDEKTSGVALNITALNKKLKDAQNQVKAVEEELIKAKQNIDSYQAEAESAGKEFDAVLIEVNETVAQWGCKVLTTGAEQAVAEIAKEFAEKAAVYKRRFDSYSENKINLEKLKVQKESLDPEESRLRFEADKDVRDRAMAELKALKENRSGIFGNRIVDSEEKAFKEALEKLGANREWLEKRKADAASQMDQSKALEGSYKAELEGLKAENRTTEKFQDLEAAKQNLRLLDNKTRDERSQLLLTLKENEENGAKHAEAEKKAAKAMAEKPVWENIQGFVGVKDGSEFQEYVQGLAFDRLLKIANSYVFSISGKYTLVQKGNQVDFMVHDENYPDAKDDRPVSNMSGGEKFIISLSLALGIAELASRNIRVDSLFLDEGFGTLSGEPLVEAVNALKSLQNKGKMLGIITHVEGVINEFDQKIVAVKERGGVSRLKGSGISFEK